VNFYDFALFAADWLKCANPFDPNCVPEGMVRVPGGEFPYQNSTPIFVDTFFIDKYEVTNEQYCQFLNDADPCGLYYDPGMEIDINDTDPYNCSYTVQDGNENHPIRYVNFYDANTFAEWRSRVEGVTYRLPTEQEWEKAAGWDPVEEHHYTYGYHQDIHGCEWMNYKNCYGGPLEVGRFNGTGGKEDAKCYYGCYDMSGNVWEWTSSIYSGIDRVIRGGYWISNAASCEVTHRNSINLSDRNGNVGIRLVRELE
jgi:formylglycine-generating enzyme required for sulfatase activity